MQSLEVPIEHYVEWRMPVKPRIQPAAKLPTISDGEIAKLKKSLAIIDNETQKTLDQYGRQPLNASVLRKLANNYTMMSRIHNVLKNNEQALEDGMHAVDMLARICEEDQNFGDFYKIAEFYHHLAEMHAQDKALAEIFQFGCDYFSGSKTVCFSRLKAVVNACRKQAASNMICHSALSQLIKLIQGKNPSDQFPANVLKDELKSYYYQKSFDAIREEVTVQRNNLLDQVCDEIRVLIDEVNAPQVHANVEMKVDGFEQPVRVKASAGGMFAPEAGAKPGRVKELAKKMDAYPIMK
jgi:hypothetical protein